MVLFSLEFCIHCLGGCFQHDMMGVRVRVRVLVGLKSGIRIKMEFLHSKDI